jgi:hypothetical protein
MAPTAIAAPLRGEVGSGVTASSEGFGIVRVHVGFLHRSFAEHG